MRDHKNKFPMRQIHLDFHNSEEIKNIAGDFSGEKFAEQLLWERQSVMSG